MKTISGFFLITTLFLLSIPVFFSPIQVHASTKTVSLPISIDYQLLKSLIIKTAYTDPGQTAILLNENDGCMKITISEPSIKEESSLILFETKVHIVAGTFILNNCIMPLEWEGYLALAQKPIIDSKWNLSFKTVDSTLYDKHHRSTKITGVVWDLAKTHVYEYLEDITINLAPPILEFKSILVEVFPIDLHANVTRMIESMKPGKLNPASAALQIGILTEVPEALNVETDIEREQISTEELEVFINSWETWDSFLVVMITSLSNEPISQHDRQILLDTLLETRHRFITGLLDENVERDFVRDQFISTWENLSPIFRNQLGDDPSKSLFGYLAFFTAADALSALDKISPTMGIQISRNGLIRLARLLAEDESLTLDYNIGVDSKLREILGLGAPPIASSPVTHMEELEIGEEEIELIEDNDSSLKKLKMFFMCKSAWANADKPTITFNDIIPWVFSKKNIETYVDRIKALLEETSNGELNDSKIENRYHDLYRLIVLSTAWQESCFRQFRVRKKKVTYLLSYNRSSVGLMQVNERVWRGMYDRQHLRWDIQYNAAAGCEILEIYIRKYTLDRIKKRKLVLNLDDDTMARIVYAMYNGGPGQFDKILKRNKEGTFYTSDKLYFEKYSWVKNNQWKNIRKCLIGG
ncbi:MAG: lytic transglycosylase domain-containing protein [Thermodesulfobacteriota bacterium]